MSTATLPRDNALRPQRADGMGSGAVLAILVHALLIAALAYSVNWHVSDPQGVTAELWSAVPQIAAPRAVEPAPPPPTPAPVPVPAPTPVARVVAPPPPQPDLQAQRDADIAIEKAAAQRKKQEDQAQLLAQQRLAQQQKLQQQQEQEQEQRALKQELARKQTELDRAKKAEQQARAAEAAEAQAAKDKAQKLAKDKADKDKQAKAAAQTEADKRAQQADDARLAKQREDYLKRIIGQAGATGGENSAGTALRDAGPSASYGGKVIAAILPNILSIRDIDGDPTTEVMVHCAPDGTILSRRVARSSGDKEWDDEVIRAIDRTARLPRDDNGRTPADILVTFNPKLKAR